MKSKIILSVLFACIITVSFANENIKRDTFINHQLLDNAINYLKDTIEYLEKVIVPVDPIKYDGEIEFIETDQINPKGGAELRWDSGKFILKGDPVKFLNYLGIDLENNEVKNDKTN